MSQYNFKNIVEPKSGLIVYRDAYWLCKDGDETQALFYGNSPQANKNRKILEWSLSKDMYKNIEGLEIVHVEIAFIPQRD